MPDIKSKGNKWILVSDDKKKKEEFDTKEEAVKRLKEWEGHAAHEKEPKGFRHKKKSEIAQKLITLADKLDEAGFDKLADGIDSLLTNDIDDPEEAYINRKITPEEARSQLITDELAKLDNIINEHVESEYIRQTGHDIINNLKNTLKRMKVIK